jgi:hypothetical protein
MCLSHVSLFAMCHMGRIERDEGKKGFTALWPRTQMKYLLAARIFLPEGAAWNEG